MRVLVVHNRYRSAAPSGENRVVDQETQALEVAGHTVDHFERLSDDIEHWSVSKRALLPARVVHNGEVRRTLSESIRHTRPDVVHIHNTFPVMSPSVLHACRDEGVPAVVTIHNYKLLCASGDLYRDGNVCHDCVGRSVALPALAHRCYRGSFAATIPVAVGLAVNRRAWQSLVSAYVFISESQRRICASLDLPQARTFVKANLVPAIAAPVPAPEREHLVAYLGRLDEAKGIPLLMKAWQRFAAGAPSGGLRLVIAGHGPLADTVKAWSAGRDEVDVVGTLDVAGCAALLSRARAVILPSQWEETFGLVAVEAMAAGVAPVAAAHGSFPELIGEGTGVLFTPGDAAALAHVLGDVDADPGRFAAYGAAARRAYLTRFDPGANLEQLLEVYRFAIDHPVRRDHGQRSRPESSHRPTVGMVEPE